MNWVGIGCFGGVVFFWFVGDWRFFSSLFVVRNIF